MNIWNTFLFQPLVNALLVFYSIFFHNLGLAILVLTILIRLMLLPLTLPSQKAMQKMRDLAPELARIKKKHAGDKTKTMQAQADLYKAHGVNPASGCLPQIVQLVVLIALFNVFRIALVSGADVASRMNSYAYSFVSHVSNLDTHFLYLDLTKPDVFHLQGIPFPLPGPFLILAALFQFVSSKMLSPVVEAEKKAAQKTEEPSDDIMAATQQQMLYLFPVLTIFIGLTFASGLVLYWFVFSLLQTAQQYLTSGWGGLSPFLRRVGLVQSPSR